MKRRFTALLLICLLAFSMVSSVSAAEARRATVVPRLSFTGTRANCKLSITEVGAKIDATMELWSGSILVDSWHKTGTSTLFFSETKTVQSGKTYTLTAHGTIGSTTFTAPSITKTCP